MFLVLGLAIGLLIAFGPLDALSAPFDSLNASMVTSGHEVLDAVLAQLGPDVAASPAAKAFQICLSVTVPALVGACLVVAAQAAQRLRSAVLLTLFLGALLSFFVLPFGQALALAAVAGVLVVLTLLTGGGVVPMVLVTMATVLGARHVVMVWTGANPEIGPGAIELASLTGGAGVELWKTTLSVLATSPFVYTALHVLGWTKKDEKSKKD
jgi:hypothetical protein